MNTPHYLQAHLGTPALDRKAATTKLELQIATAREELNSIYQQVAPTGWLENDFRALAGTLTEASERASRMTEVTREARDEITRHAANTLISNYRLLAGALADQKTKRDLMFVMAGGNGLSTLLGEILTNFRSGLKVLHDLAGPDLQEVISSVAPLTAESKGVA